MPAGGQTGTAIRRRVERQQYGSRRTAIMTAYSFAGARVLRQDDVVLRDCRALTMTMTMTPVLGAAVIALLLFGWLARVRYLRGRGGHSRGGNRRGGNRRGGRYFSVDLAESSKTKPLDP